MRIDAYNTVSQVFKTKAPGNIQSTTYTGGKDQVSISQFGQDFQTAKQALASVSDIREDKVNTLKASIDSDEYVVDDEEFANKLIEKYYGLENLD